MCLNRKLEDQLRTVRLEDEHEAKQVYQSQLTARTKFLIRDHTFKLQKQQTNIDKIVALKKDFLKEIESDFKTRYRITDKRKAHSENGHETYATRERTTDKHLYNYFTNSARQFATSERSDGPPVGTQPSATEYTVDDLSSIASSLQVANTRIKSQNVNALLYCKKCQNQLGTNENCNRCQEHGTTSNDEQFLCEICSRKMLCSRCMREICMKCHKRRTKSLRFNGPEEPFLTDDRRRTSRHNVDTDGRQRTRALDDFDSDSSHELDVNLSSPVVVTRNNAPYSLYLEQNSIFHPSRNDAKLAVNVRNGETFVEKGPRIHDNVADETLETIRRISLEKANKYAKQPPKKHGQLDHIGLSTPVQAPKRTTTISMHRSPAFRMLEQLQMVDSELDMYS